MASSSLPVTEIEIPVPWGHIAGKSWGDARNFPVIVLHGTLDNCGSFDRLIPLLPQNFHYICLDMPSHGKSSHFPNGLPLESLNFVLSVKYVVDYLKVSKFYIMGHSLGAQIALFFAALYPENVVKLICLDGIIPEPIIGDQVVSHTRKRMDNVYSSIPGKTPPSYSFEEALERLMKNRFSQLTEESARTMIKRSLVESSSGFHFSSDQRLKGFWRIPFSLKQIKEFVLSIKCPLLLVLARDTVHNQLICQDIYVERLQTLLYGSIDVKVVTVDGNHDVHLNHSERVAVHVAPFLLEQRSHL